MNFPPDADYEDFGNLDRAELDLVLEKYDNNMALDDIENETEIDLEDIEFAIEWFRA